MVFSSLYFIFIFLPAVTVLYFLAKKIWPEKIIIRNIILCLSSFFFYAWGEPVYIILMLVSITCNFLFAKSRSKFVFVTAIIFNLAFLFFFKYLGFAAENIAKLFSSITKQNIQINVPTLELPIGISFYTFQALSYIIDVHRKKTEPQKNIISLALYISLFPQLIAGPVVRYTDIEKELSERKETFSNFIDGLKTFVFGLGCKVIIANNLATVADNILGSPQDVGSAITWLSVLSYSMQIYFDFSGYSRMAIGIGKMFGFNFPENFNDPYCASSISDFWRRWHITLSRWFRDYVYIPLGGNRVGVPRHIMNILVTWLVTGFWHGAGWNFILWGLYYALLLIFEKYVTLKIIEHLSTKKRILCSSIKIVTRIVSLILIMTGWAIFRSENLLELSVLLKKLFVPCTGSFGDTISFVAQHADTCSKFIFLVPAIVMCLPFRKKIFAKSKDSALVYNIELLSAFLIFAVSVCLLIASTYNPFIYFRF